MFRIICTLLTLLCNVEASSWPFKEQGTCDLDSRINDAVNSAEKLEKLYDDYKSEHGVEHHSRETPQRLEIFKQSLQHIQRLKSDERVTWKVGITFMSHMTECEKSLYHGDNNNTSTQLESSITTVQSGRKAELKAGEKAKLQDSGNAKLQSGGYFGYLPYTWDWRTENAVSAVQDQTGPNCWAHTAIVPLEAQLSVFRGKLKQLSSQELIDCVYWGTPLYNDGGGGHRDHAWVWLQKHQHLAARSAVPDRAEIKDCKWITQARHTNALKDYVLQEIRVLKIADDELPILETLATESPVGVSMQTKDAELETYRGGAYDWRATQCKSGGVGHAMAIIGYTIRYYIIKNSWGTKWGEDGYLMWVRSAVSGYNCDMFRAPSYPLLMKKYYYAAKKK